MKYDICSIPISEVFEPKDGCPVCRLRDLLESRMIEYITGAAMMEPDVRIETNKTGFCLHHYAQCMKQHKHLSVALTMQTRLATLDQQVFGNGMLPKDPVKQGKAALESMKRCFVCEQIDQNMSRMLENACHVWMQERDFRQLFAEQPDLCLPHFGLLTEAAERVMRKKERTEFCKQAAAISQRSLHALKADVDHFCRMYDYRNRTENTDWGTSKDAPERSVRFLTSRPLEK
ncbi:MAG: hypothetical protein IJC17_03615 [Clostridia bacterium]|nr:hypothetical protein [Clostridia bacterium]